MKIHISRWWLLFLPWMLLSHMGKTLLFLFGILSIHECAHIVTALYFHYPVSSLTLYPFGLCAQIHDMGMGSVWKEFLIVTAGPLTHLLVPWLLRLCCEVGMISASYTAYLCELNTSILIFNLLPIFPLDGGRMMQSLFHLFFRYTTAQRMTYLCSIIHLVLLLYFQMISTYSAWFVMAFLLFQIIACWKQLPYEKMAFYHYRKLHPSKARLRANTSEDLYRAFTNVILTKHGWMLEDAWLKANIRQPRQSDVCRMIL